MPGICLKFSALLCKEYLTTVATIEFAARCILQNKVCWRLQESVAVLYLRGKYECRYGKVGHHIIRCSNVVEMTEITLLPLESSQLIGLCVVCECNIIRINSHSTDAQLQVNICVVMLDCIVYWKYVIRHHCLDDVSKKNVCLRDFHQPSQIQRLLYVDWPSAMS